MNLKWRQVIEYNHYHCTRCGERLAEVNSKPIKGKLFNRLNTVYCKRCDNIVGRITK